MKAEEYEIEQTLHGYDRGHRLLAYSTRLSSDDERAMLTMSDLSGARVVDGFFEYITGYMLPSNDLFALAKTWYATEMKRPGCVWTHTLLLPRSLLTNIRDAVPFLQLFVRPELDLKYKYSDKLSAPASVCRSPSSDNFSLSAEEVAALRQLYQYDKGAVGISVSSGMECDVFLLRVWSQMWPNLRSRVGFCSGSLSPRIMNGRPLDLQCGPDRIVREMKADQVETNPVHLSWLAVVMDDLLLPGAFREFLNENASDLTSRSAMAALGEIFKFISSHDYSSAIQILTLTPLLQQGMFSLKQAVLVGARESDQRFELSPTLLALSSNTFSGMSSEVNGVMKRLFHQDPRKFLQLSETLREEASLNSVSALIDTIVVESSQTDFEWMSEAVPQLFNEVLLQRPAIFYESGFWNWNFSLFEKVDLFRNSIHRPEVDRHLLFNSVFKSGDAELLSRLVGELSESELPLVLEWIQSNGPAAISLEWIAFLRDHQPGFISWLNQQANPTVQTLILAANVLQEPPPLHSVLSPDSILRLAKTVYNPPSDRHEVAAFLFVTTAWVRSDVIASTFVASFAILHKAIAQSRLSNRAWELISSSLLPLPHQDWDGCEKLRRATLHFLSVNGWSFRTLWGVVNTDLDLFYDFVRTARAYEEGKNFFTLVYDAAQRGDISLEKKQAKELRKLLEKNWW